MVNNPTNNKPKLKQNNKAYTSKRDLRKEYMAPPDIKK